jgi:hypothetical protein
MPNTEQLGHAGLVGWRGAVADRVARPVAKKAPANEDQVRAVVGAAFFLLSLYWPRAWVRVPRGKVASGRVLPSVSIG